MRWVIGIVVSLIAVVGLACLIGYFLPVTHEASRSAEFNKPPREVFALFSDVPNYKQWWPGNDTRVAVVESVPPTRVVTQIVDETAFGGTWTIEIAPTATGSRVTITERGEVHNLIFRTLSRFVFGYTRTMESCLTAAGRRLNT